MTDTAGAGLHFESLGDPTLRAWPGVASCLPEGAYLAGGSALALRLGHRRSYDLDLFCRQQIDCDHLVAGVTAAFADTGGVAVDIVSHTRVAARLAGTRIDYTYDPTDLIGVAAAARGIPVAGIDDITAMKVAAVTDRAAMRDWYDLMMIQRRIGLSHRECFLLYRERFGAVHGAATVARVADTLCQWYPGMPGLVPDPHLRDIDGQPVEAATREYWMAQQAEVSRQLSMFKRRTARAQPPGIVPRTLGGASPALEGENGIRLG